EGQVIARTVQVAVENALRDRQMEDVRRVVDEITGYKKILGVRIFDPSGSLIHQSASLEGKPFLDPEALHEMLRRRQAVHMHRQIDNAPVVNLLVPLSGPKGEPFGAAQVIQLESFVEEDARASRRSVAGLTLAVILAAGSMGDPG